MKIYRGRPSCYAVTELRDQVFSTVGGKDRLADLYLPQNPQGPCPVVIWVHGGGWRFGDRRMAPDLSRYFAQRGLAMVSFDYRLSEEAIFPAAVEDLKTCIRWVRSLAANGTVAESVGLWGSSAGAHLAACAALSAETEFATAEHAGFSSIVQAVVDGYGPTDFSRIDADRPAPGSKPQREVEGVTVPNVLPATHPESFESRFLGTPVLAQGSPEVDRANPIRYVGSSAPPFLILHGLYDPLIPFSQSRMLFDALSARGHEVTLLGIERLGHGFFNRADLDFADPGEIHCHGGDVPGEGFGFGMVEAFFRKHLFQM